MNTNRETGNDIDQELPCFLKEFQSFVGTLQASEPGRLQPRRVNNSIFRTLNYLSKLPLQSNADSLFLKHGSDTYKF